MSHDQTTETKSKIGAAVVKSSWRRRAGDKANEAASVAGSWDEDFQSPSIHRKGRRYLVEERPFYE
jgi:hypothetical protein